MRSRELSPRLVMLITLAMVVLPYIAYVISIWSKMPVHEGEIIGQTDPDVWMRLTLVREWLTSGDWHNHTIPNYNLPEGSTSPWTRPLDMVIAGLALLQPDSINLTQRIMHAALILPILWLTLMLMGIYRIVKLYAPLASVYLMASVLLLSMPAARNYFGVGNADHHAPLAVLFIWVMSTILKPQPSRAQSIFAGFLLALMVWMSTEAMILIAGIYIWYGLQWLKGQRAPTVTLCTLSTSAATFATLALMIEVPRAAWAEPIYDTISIVYVVALWCVVPVCWFMRLTVERPLAQRILWVGISGAIAAATILINFPLIIHGPLATVDPFIRSEFMPRVSEAKSFYDVAFHEFASAATLPILALLLCLATWLKPSMAYYRKSEAPMLAFFMAITLLLYLMQQRWGYYIFPLAMAAMAPLYACMFNPTDPRVAGRWPAIWLGRLSPNQQSACRIAVVLITLALPYALYFGIQTTSSKNETNLAQLGDRKSCLNEARILIRSGELTRALGTEPKTILVTSDIATEILFFTPHRIIASNYHRDGAALRYVWETFDAPDEQQLHSALRARKIDVVINCPELRNRQISALKRYQGGEPLPSWLRPIDYTPPPPNPHMKAKQPRMHPQLLRVMPVADR